MECVSSKPRNIIFDQILSFVELQYLRMQDFYSKYYLGWDDPFHTFPQKSGILGPHSLQWFNKTF